jgi:hypothetical protein
MERSRRIKILKCKFLNFPSPQTVLLQKLVFQEAVERLEFQVDLIYSKYKNYKDNWGEKETFE